MSWLPVRSNGSESSTACVSKASNGGAAPRGGSYWNSAGGATSRSMCSTQPLPPNVVAASVKSVPTRTSDLGLFVAERFNGVEPCGATSGPDAEEQAHADAERRGEADRFGRDEDLPARKARQRARGDDPEQDTEPPAEQAQRHRFDEELQQDGEPRRTERHANTDLTRPLGHAHEHDVHD